jgi:hypothetical protein
LLAERHGPVERLTLERAPLRSAESFSGVALERVVVRGPDGPPASYVIKQLTPLGDWLARALGDDRLREQRLATSGLLDALPEGVGAAVVAATPLRDGQAWLLMRDVTPLLAPPGDLPFSDAQVDVALNGLAALHSAFADLPAERADELALCQPGDWLTLLSPRTARREEATAPPDHLTRLFIPAWERVAARAPDAWRVLEPLLDDPTPLVAALDRVARRTLTHSDAKAGNFAFAPGQLILLDWAAANRGFGALELAWFLTVNAAKLPRGRDDAIARYRAARQRHGVLPARGPEWERELALGLLGGALLAAWQKVFGLESPDPAVRAREQAELDFWTGAAVAGARLL